MHPAGLGESFFPAGGVPPAMLYRLVRPLLFRWGSETAHERVLGLMERLDRHPRLRRFLHNRYTVDDPRLETEVFGVSFPNPVGVAAGFDKDARLPRVLPCLGFGSVEVGTVTPEPQEGNPRPRMWRFPDEEAIVNALGFPNEGAEAVSTRIAQEGRPSVPLGVNMGKNKDTPLEEAPSDYVKILERFHPLVDYVVVNVSSPNTPGLRDLQGREHLESILEAVQQANRRVADDQDIAQRPLLLKVSPDLTDHALDDVVEVTREHGVDGLIATNTTTDREGVDDAPTVGGLSGAPLRDRATRVVEHLYRATRGDVPIVGVGGVATAEDAIEKIEHGASLVQVYTGFVYGGPATASRINRGISRELAARELDRLDELVGAAVHL